MIPLILMLITIATPVYAAETQLPIRANVIQCGRMQDMEQSCKDNPVCCRFLEPAAGPQADTAQQSTDCEVMVMPDGQEIPACVVNNE